MQMQLTLDGEPTEMPCSILDSIIFANKIARENPYYFACVCAEHGIAYKGSPSTPRTLSCCYELQEGFGFFTENMIAALMAYPIEV